MPATPGPPPAVAPEVGRAAVVRGVALTVPAALLGVAAAVRVDAWLDLPGWGRGLLAVAWLLVAAAAGWGWTASPVRPGGRFGAMIAGVLAALSLAVVPAAGDRIRRLFLPFYTPLPDLPYRLTASSGDPAVARGSSVILTAFADPTDASRPIPETATLIVRDRPGGPERRLPMSGDGRGVFRVTRAEVADGFEYAVEVGPARTGWHTVTVVDPVGLADGTTIRVEPPDYAKAARRPRTVEGFQGFDGPQFGRAEFDLRLTHPAADIAVTWKTDADGPISIPHTFSPDRAWVHANLPLSISGILTLTLVADRGVRTGFSIPVGVVPDTPPRFETATGLGIGPWEVAADEVIRGDLRVRDDLGVAAVRWEYDINGDPKGAVPIPLARLGPGWAAGSFALQLAGQVKDGDTVRVRVLATDNRAVPESSVTAHQATYPPNGWAVYRVDSSPRNTLYEQMVAADRDRLKAKLGATADVLVRAGRRVADVDGELTRSGSNPGFAVDQTVRLTEAKDDSETVAVGLTAFAAELAVVPELRPTAATARGATDDIRRAANHLRIALATGHAPAVSGAVASFRAATDGLSALVAGADQVAQLRLDRHELRAIADALRRGTNTTARNEASRRISALVSASPVLSAASVGADLDALRELAARTTRLGEEHQRLTAATMETARLIREQSLADLVAKQTAFDAQAAAFADRTRVAARIAGASLISADPGRNVVAALRDGRTTDAAAEAEKLAQEFDRRANAFEKTAAGRTDVRETVRQLARWQTDLRQRVADTTRPTADDRQRFASEQRSVRDALIRVAVPPGSAVLADAKSTALAAAAAAGDGPEVAAMTKASEALSEFAEKIPSREQRLTASRAAVERLLREQAAITRSPPDDSAADRQDALAGQLDALDALEFGHRRDAAADAARRAATDLRDGFALDVPASQSHARRQLDRLRQTLADDVTDDERAAELAKQQRDLADAADKLPPDPTGEAFRTLQNRQKDLTKSLTALSTTDAPSLLFAARVAAEQAARQSKPDAFRKQARSAAEATGCLAARLRGAESDLDRVRSLAAQVGPQTADEFASVRAGNRPSRAEARGRRPGQVAVVHGRRPTRAPASRCGRDETTRRRDGPERRPFDQLPDAAQAIVRRCHRYRWR